MNWFASSCWPQGYTQIYFHFEYIDFLIYIDLVYWKYFYDWLAMESQNECDNRSKISVSCELGEKSLKETAASYGSQVSLIRFAEMPSEGSTVNALLRRWKEVWLLCLVTFLFHWLRSSKSAQVHAVCSEWQFWAMDSLQRRSQEEKKVWGFQDFFRKGPIATPGHCYCF